MCSKRFPMKQTLSEIIFFLTFEIFKASKKPMFSQEKTCVFVYKSRLFDFFLSFEFSVIICIFSLYFFKTEKCMRPEKKLPHKEIKSPQYSLT